MKSIRRSNGTLIQRGILAAIFGTGLASPALADDLDADVFFAKPVTQRMQFGISPFYGYQFGGSVQDANTGADYALKDGPAFGVILDYAPKDYYGRYELIWSHQDSSVNFGGNYGLGDVDMAIDVIQVGGELEFGSNRLRATVSAHLGATHFSPDDCNSETKFSYDIGAGVKAFLTKNLYLRGDIRGICTVTDANASFIYVNGTTVATFSGYTLWQGQVSAGIGITF